MKNRLIYKGLIEDVRNEKCSDLEIEKLLDVFEEAVKSMAETPAKKSFYDLKDFKETARAGLNLFTLTLEREPIKNYEKYTGHFECGKKNLMDKISSFDKISPRFTDLFLSTSKIRNQKMMWGRFPLAYSTISDTFPYVEYPL